MTTTKPKRRFFRYSLRTLMLVVTVFCIWLGIAAKRARDQKQAVEAILEVGGNVQYEHQSDKSEPPGPEWLRQLIGDEYFFTVVSVDLIDAQFGDPDLDHLMEHLKTLKLRRLGLDHTRVTNAGLDYLNGLPCLEWLTLPAQVTDAGLAHIKGLTKLRRLTLNDSGVSDLGLVNLKGLHNLEFLSLRGTKITNDGLAHLNKLTKLEWLDLYGTNVSEARAREFKEICPKATVTSNLRRY